LAGSLEDASRRGGRTQVPVGAAIERDIVFAFLIGARGAALQSGIHDTSGCCATPSRAAVARASSPPGHGARCPI